MSTIVDAPKAAGKEKEEPKSFARRDHLHAIEADVQGRWAAAKAFESDAPADADNKQKPKFMVTFPYPYMNGRLHLGHAYSLTKADFAAGYQRLRGKHVLFPFAFHCTGMPIQAAANKLKREIETGSYLAMRADAAKAAAQAAAAAEEEAAEGPGDAAASAASAHGGAGTAAPAPAPAAAGKPPSEPGKKFTSKKSKQVAKTGSAPLSQFDILLKSGITEAQVPLFQDPHHWLSYFPPLGKQDLTSFGCHIDWRRSFITTDANPYYDSFIRWQFNTLRRRGKLGFGKRPTVYSVLDGQACADHDRASGEGVVPQEYTLIKIALQPVPAAHHAAAALAAVTDAMVAGKRVYLVAATLRPETMYGQTNVFLLPEGEYGAFAVSATDIFICSERSARNMAYQGLALEGKGVLTRVGGALRGDDLMGLPLSAPHATYGTVYTLPLMTISMKKGTGVVTSVPSDAPDDWAALRDLKNKPAMREKYHLTEAMVAPDVVEIIDIPGFGRQAAVKICDELKIRSQNDKALLAEAKDRVYNAGFYQGVMLVGRYAGRKVCDAKPLVRADMIAEGTAAAYWEPEGEVISRSGDECVVAEVDQWYLRYGDDEWRGAVEAWVRSGAFRTYGDKTAAAFEAVLAWLKEWACSRSFGLGTRLPWDPQFLVESLSDSTIYMAYYTVAHLLQGGDVAPHTPSAVAAAATSAGIAAAAPAAGTATAAVTPAPVGPSGVHPAQLSDAVWDYIFGEDDAPVPAPSAETAAAAAAAGVPDAPIPASALAALRREFRYWYPLDLRVSGRDLIGNHLTMSLYNHAAMWPGPGAAEAAGGSGVAGAPAVRADRMPQSIFANGFMCVDGEKMSKARGNFWLLADAVARWGADATRIGLADAGDTLEDGNFEVSSAENGILRLTAAEEYAQEALADADAGRLRTGDLTFADKVFDAHINRAIAATQAAFDGMRFREGLQACLFVLMGDRDTYRDTCAKLEVPVHAAVLRRFLEVQCVLLAPICPHWCEHVWQGLLGHTGESVTSAPWPAARPIDEAVLRQDAYLQSRLHAFRVSITKAMVGKKGSAASAAALVGSVKIYVASRYSPVQSRVLQVLAGAFDAAVHPGSNGFPADVLATVKAAVLADPAFKSQVKGAMELASVTVLEHAGRSSPLPQLLTGMPPVDEHATWTANLDYVAKCLELPAAAIAVLRVEDAGALAGDASGRAKDAAVMSPVAVPTAAASAATAAAPATTA